MYPVCYKYLVNPFYPIYSASFNTRYRIFFLQLSPLLFVREEEKKDKERRHEEKARRSRRLFWLFLVAYGVIRYNFFSGKIYPSICPTDKS